MDHQLASWTLDYLTHRGQGCVSDSTGAPLGTVLATPQTAFYERFLMTPQAHSCYRLGSFLLIRNISMSVIMNTYMSVGACVYMRVCTVYVRIYACVCACNCGFVNVNLCVHFYTCILYILILPFSYLCFYFILYASTLYRSFISVTLLFCHGSLNSPLVGQIK